MIITRINKNIIRSLFIELTPVSHNLNAELVPELGMNNPSWADYTENLPSKKTAMNP